MNKRMMALLALLAGAGVFVAVDSSRNTGQGVVELAPRTGRKLPAEAASAVSARLAEPGEAASAASAVADAGPAVVRDIFSLPAPSPVAEAAPPPPPPPPPPPFRLLGFREEGGVREAYLLQNGAVVLVKMGTQLEDRYEVVGLSEQDVKIRDRVAGRDYEISWSN